MAVVLTYPADPGQLGKSASGEVAAFTATGYQSEGSGLTVTITNQTLGGLVLGSGPSNTDAEPSGTYAGWWAFSVYCPAFDSTGSVITIVESAEAFVAASASLRMRAGSAEAANASAESASEETGAGIAGGTSESVPAYADGLVRIRAIVGDVFSGAAADSSSAEVSAGASGLITSNPGFESASPAIGSTEVVGQWYATVSAAASVAARHASATMTGSYVGRCYAEGDFDGEGTPPATAALWHKVTAAQVDAAPTLTFDVRCVDRGARCTVECMPKDSGGVDLITADATTKWVLVVDGTSGSAADITTIKLSSVVVGTVYARTFNVKTWIEGRLNAGKTWADVAHVVLGFAVGSATDATCEWFFDNFR